MLAIFLDYFGGVYLGRRIKNVFLLILAALGLGILNSLIVSLIMMPMYSGNFAATMAQFATGVIYHPVITVAVALYNRHYAGKSQDLEPDQAERERRRQQALEAQRKMQERTPT
jgi:hypothetical protein